MENQSPAIPKWSALLSKPSPSQVYWIGSSMPCIRATLPRNDLDLIRLLVYRTNKANYRTDLISSTMIVDGFIEPDSVKDVLARINTKRKGRWS